MSNYNKQLNEKVIRIREQFNLSDLQIYPSPEWHYRMRVEFRIWHMDDDVFYAMFERGDEGNKKVVRIDKFPIASVRINNAMPQLIDEVKKHTLLKDKLFQVDFLSGLSGELLISMIYHKSLDEQWIIAAKKLEKILSAKIIGRSRKQKIILSDDFITEVLSVNIHGISKKIYYQQIEGGFSQPNAFVCQHMLNWACKVAHDISQFDHHKKDLLELYCGNGNFTLPLSHYYRKVLATEMAKSSVNAAKWAIDNNQIDNIAIARLSAEEFSQAHKGVRQFRRLEEAGIDMSDYEFNTVFVDPPRAGIDDDTLMMLQEFENIIYISCNPDTLFKNLQVLNRTHDIKRFALFDQFAYTHHIESGVWLTKRHE